MPRPGRTRRGRSPNDSSTSRPPRATDSAMRVTHVITRLIVGGAQENTLNSVLGLRQKPDMDVKLISGPTTGPEGSIESEVATVPNLLTILPELVRPVHPWKDIWAFRRLAEVLRAQGTEIV